MVAPGVAAAAAPAAVSGVAGDAGADPGETSIDTWEQWWWPVRPVRIAEPFVAPAHAYGPGHRGIDLRAAGVVTAPASGVIAFAGVVVDRPLVTIAHPGGLVTTLEPVLTPLRPGTPVIRGMPIGVIAVGGHAAPGTVHFGVRLHGEYVNPLLLLGGVPRAVLLPCC
ncbi:peptidase M23 [Microbacterium sediminis]|uniref:Peptidase M23 n=1 Tax=Microbacterium sediminis TaxID=904291 RepID=A0A1B9NFQ2_9MICO|nr:peptidase M23 [Microbacterium sediminis]